MKEITQQDIDVIKTELATKRKEFEELNFQNLDKKLNWIANFFNSYIPELEKRYMTEEEREDRTVYLPNELRIHLYMYFPEHGLNMANAAHDLQETLAREEFK